MKRGKMEMTRERLIQILKDNKVGGEAKRYDLSSVSPGEMLRDCNNPDYIMAALLRLHRFVPARLWVQLTTAFARVLFPYAVGGDGSTEKAIKTAEAWLNGKAGKSNAWKPPPLSLQAYGENTGSRFRQAAFIP